MSENNNLVAGSNKFNFGQNQRNSQENKQIDEVPTDGNESDMTSISNKDTVDSAKSSDNGIYIDERFITVQLVRNYSRYREINRATLSSKVDYIGSSIISSRTLTANKQEMDAYMPRLIGISPSDPNFVYRVKSYFNNIQIQVNAAFGKKFDISFRYNHKSDYEIFAKKEEQIEERYKQANRQSIKDLRVALDQKLNDLNNLESTKFMVGEPVNLEDYLMYRHCLLYKDIAKDLSFINVDNNIRFYFKDEKKETEKLKKYRNDVANAKKNYVACLSDPDLFKAVYIQYCVFKGLPILQSLLEENFQQEIKLDAFSTEDPIKFNKFCTDKDVKIASTIEQLIARGELIRLQHNQNITTPDGTFIGANMHEALVYFKSPENNQIVQFLINKLKNI